MTIQEDLTQSESPQTDLTKVAALHQKRTLAFVNHFLTINVQFLNNFMRNCEQKLMQFERKLEKVNAAMVLLESKLSSIPELDIPKQTNTSNVTETESTESQNETELQEENLVRKLEDQAPAEVKTKPEYDKFVKMVQVGVPLQAVKLKVSLEGLDPEILEQLIK